ncbi:hypothetical protein GCM10022244_06370 [Streptomyces gulbargensis]|uniref:Integral membrane protein n=1 Tax=Streptomyces gulbargensis TaxID=364901 RepID=A0ABP7LHB8_9ACTN
MSFGEPNNPYGQPPQGQQPGYGYPQQTPQGTPPQQGYGYPAAPPAAPYGGGYPGAVMEMPGGVKAARVMLWILAICQIVMGVATMVAGGWVADQIMDRSADLDNADGAAAAVTGAFVVVGILALAFGIWALVMALKTTKGGNGLRISAIVYASLVTAISLLSLLGTNVFALISLVLGILIIVFYAKSDAVAWFKRNQPQY